MGASTECPVTGFECPRLVYTEDLYFNDAFNHEPTDIDAPVIHNGSLGHTAMSTIRAKAEDNPDKCWQLNGDVENAITRGCGVSIEQPSRGIINKMREYIGI